jgi:uncharacterized membrane protein
MSTIAQFLKTTFIGGLLVLVPIYVSVLLLLKTFSGLIAVLHPVTALLPDRLHELRQVAALALIVLASFGLGLIVRTRPGRFMLGELERRVLERIPGFGLVRGIVHRVSGRSDDEMFQPVLVEIEEALTPAFVVEELDDDRFVVLVPSVPTPAAGSLYVLPRARVHWVDVPVTQAIGVITRWGSGTGKLVKAIR